MGERSHVGVDDGSPPIPKNRVIPVPIHAAMAALPAPPNEANLLKKRADLISATVTIEFNTRSDDSCNTCVRPCFDELLLETHNKEELCFDIQSECHKHMEHLMQRSKFDFSHFCDMLIFRIFVVCQFSAFL